MRTDDSVVRALSPALRRRPLLIRRSRGFVPESLELPVAGPRHVLACGAELKSTFCLAKRSSAWVGHHIGDLKSYETLISFREGIEHFKRVFAIEPGLVAHDMHPDYLSTAYALELEGVDHVAVQHHHAHLAACLAEHGETEPAIGAIFDGTGYGPDGTVWGGELLAGDLGGYERVGALLPVRLPGGDAAVRAPWRMACAWLSAAGEERSTPPPTLARRGRAGRVGGGQRPGRERRRLADDDQRRAAVRRGRGALRVPRPGQLRGAGRGRARGDRRPGRARRVSAPGGRSVDA